MAVRTVRKNVKVRELQNNGKGTVKVILKCGLCRKFVVSFGKCKNCWVNT